MLKNLFVVLIFLTPFNLMAQQPEPFELNEEWVKKIEGLAPSHTEVKTDKAARVLVFNLITGYNHWVTPHTAEVIRVLGDKSGAYEVVMSTDIYEFEKKNLKQYDAIVLNNNCSSREKRDMFWDVLNESADLTEKEKLKEAARLEANLIDYVKNGGGLAAIHGGIIMQNNSMAFSTMMGGSFDYHPKRQEIILKMVDPEHKLVKSFEGKAFVHVDEPYLFKNAYENKEFRPLLYMETSKLENKKAFDAEIAYVSWIKRYGKGRVFYSSPSHNAQSFEDERLLKFMLDGLQYVLGDLECDDSPMNNENLELAIRMSHRWILSN